MPHTRLVLSLQVKATAAVVFVVAIVLTAIASVMSNELRDQIIVRERLAADSLARAVSQSVVLPLAVRDTHELSKISEQFLWEGQTLFIAVYDMTESLVAYTAGDEDAWKTYQDAPETADRWFLGRRYIWLEHDTGLDALGLDPFDANASRQRKSGAPIGYVIAATTRQNAVEAIARERRFAIWMVLTAIGVSLPLIWMGVRRWARRLDRLVDASERIAGGDIATAIDDPRGDDIGRLSAALERMRIALEERERENRTFNDRLQHQVEERTSELREAMRAANEANRAKSAFLANMSHEIRTPLTAILGFIDLLDVPNIDDNERRSQIRIIRQNARHLLAIINDVLDISKIEAGDLLVEQIEMDPTSLVFEIVSLARRNAAEKGLEFDYSLPERMPQRIVSDPTRVRQVLMNLISNAIKFTESGSVGLSVNLDLENERLVIEVRDTGIGIGEETLARLFQPFSQADETMSRRFGGTGLGLAISRRLAKALGGDIDVQSSPGEGSVFRLEVPTGELTNMQFVAPTEAISQDDRPVIAASPEAAAGARVLLVEDGPDNRKLISFLLKKAGCEIETAENGLEGVEKATSALEAGEPYDIVLMDMQMPVMDGYTAASTLRENDYPGWIVALTAHAMSQDRDRCLRSGCDDYLSKPVDRQMLLETIAQMRTIPRAMRRRNAA